MVNVIIENNYGKKGLFVWFTKVFPNMIKKKCCIDLADLLFMAL